MPAGESPVSAQVATVAEAARPLRSAPPAGLCPQWARAVPGAQHASVRRTAADSPVAAGDDPVSLGCQKDLTLTGRRPFIPKFCFGKPSPGQGAPVPS